MTVWYRVFGTSDVEPAAEAVLGHLQELDGAVRGSFSGDEQGWFRAELVLVAEAEPTHLERYLATEEGIRGELNAWAAWLETAEDSPHHGRLMQHMVSTTQLFTLPRPVVMGHDSLVERLCTGLCRFLAAATTGVYQVDEQGFFAADGTLLVQEKRPDS
ncbi:MAG TPA: hypothetical protein VG013_06465 [Gemmataceae bacterium]|jgi:hypothetical protein|nr:hypothetical protein [Gemmataceae bacterium]